MTDTGLPSSYLKELRDLVQVDDEGGNVRAFADSRLRPSGEKMEFSRYHVQIYRELRDLGFITAVGAYGGLVKVALTPAGIDYVHDLDTQERLRAEQARIAEEKRLAEKEADRKVQFQHDRNMNMLSAALGFALGAVSTNLDRIIGALEALIGFLR